MQVTESATELLKQARAEMGAPADAGVRLQRVPAAQAGEGVRIEFAEEPEQGDEVIEEPGLRIFVSPDLADLLSERVLDADMTPNGPELWFRRGGTN